jgi:histone H3/H4
MRLVREVLHNDSLNSRIGNASGYRIQSAAISALHEAAEAALVTEFQCKSIQHEIKTCAYDTISVAHLATIHAKRVTLQRKDMVLVRSMRDIMLGYAWPGNIDRS